MITVADARQDLGLGDDTTQDQVVARLITEATASLGRELGIYLGPIVQETEIKCGGHPPGHNLVFCLEDPVVTEAYPMTVSTRSTQFDAWTVLAADQWALDGRTVVARNRFPPGRGTVRLVYARGYKVGTGPDELKDLVRQLVKIRYHAREAGSDDLLKSESMGDYSYTRRDLEMTEGWASVVDRWRRRLA